MCENTSIGKGVGNYSFAPTATRRQKFRGFRLAAVTHLRKNPCGRAYVAGIAAMCIPLAVVKSVDCSIAPQIPFPVDRAEGAREGGAAKRGKPQVVPGGASPARSEATQREGAARPPADWGQQARSASAPLAGPGVKEYGANKCEARQPRLRGHFLIFFGGSEGTLQLIHNLRPVKYRLKLG